MKLIHALSLIPLMTTILYAISVFLLYKNIKWIGQYLQKIETIFLDNCEDQDGVTLGWEKYFDKENKKKHFVSWTWTFWIVQILMAVLIVYKSYNLTS